MAAGGICFGGRKIESGRTYEGSLDWFSGGPKVSRLRLLPDEEKTDLGSWLGDRVLGSHKFPERILAFYVS